MKKIIGYSISALIFAAIYVMIGIGYGWLNWLIIFGISFVFVGLIVLAAHLITKQ